jgi:hypothetical protein
VFCGEFIAEEVEVGDKEYPQWLLYRCTLGEHVPAISFTDEALFSFQQ